MFRDDSPEVTRDTSAVETATADDGDAEPLADEPASAAESGAGVASSGSVSTIVDPPLAGGPTYLVAWGDGFLSLGTVHEPRPLPEFPPEVSELFSDEIRETIAASGADTIEAAQEALNEAGLLDATMEILSAHPDVMAAVTAPSPSRFEVWQSDDGIEWIRLDVAVPGGDNITAVSSNGTHLVIASQSWPLYPVDGPVTPVTHQISVTSDLATWNTHELVVDRPPDLPEVVRFDSWVGAVAAGPNGWVATAQSYSFVDEWELLPEEVRIANAGYSMSTSDSGITVEVYGEPVYEEAAAGIAYPTIVAGGTTCCNEPVEELFFSWDELGVDPEIFDTYVSGPGTTTVWSAPWGGSPVAVEFAVGEGGGLAATSAGFVAQTWDEYATEPTLLFSIDGRDWQEAERPETGWIQSIVAVEGGLLAMGGGGGGTTAWLGAPDATHWRPVTVPGLPDEVSPEIYSPGFSAGTGFASVVDFASQPNLDVHVDEVTYEHDGFRITESNDQFEDQYSVAILIVELGSGDTLLDATHVFGTGPGDWEEPAWLDPSDTEGITYIDPDTGDAIVTVPWDVPGDAWQRAWEAAMIDAGYDPHAAPIYEPDLWLVASPDGVNWLVEDLADPTDETAWFPHTAAINGDVVIVGGDAGWTRYTLS